MTFSKGRTSVEISLRGRARSLLFLLFIAGISLCLAAETLLAGSASFLARPEKIRSLMAFDSNDPRLEYRLGRAYEDFDPSEAVKHLRRATELSPDNRRYESYLAISCEAAGDTVCADQTWEHLANLSPEVPVYHWHAGESLLRANRLGESAAQFRRLLDLDSSYGPRAWFALRDVMDPKAIFQKHGGPSPGL